MVTRAVRINQALICRQRILLHVERRHAYDGQMHLRSYLKERKLRQKHFAPLIGTSPSNLCDICKDRKWPSRELWARIYEVTNGQVTPTDHLFPDRKESANGEST